MSCASAYSFIRNARFPAVICHREHRRQEHLNAVGIGNFGHRKDIAERTFLIIKDVEVLGNIVCAGQNHYSRRVEAHHILTEAQNHLVCRLPGDTPADEIVQCKKFRTVGRPEISNRVAHEHYTRPRIGQAHYTLVVVFVSAEIGDVVGGHGIQSK